MNYYSDYKNGKFITREIQTGKDWCNFLWNGLGYQTEVAHTGASSGLFVGENSEKILLNKKKTNIVYFRDEETKEYWNAGGYPSAVPVENFSCVHGMTFSDIVSEKNKISTKIRIAVSEKYPHEIWRVSVKNCDSRERTIGIFACSVFDMEGYAQPFYYNAFTTSETLFSESGATVVCRSGNPYAKFAYKHAFIMSGESPSLLRGI